MARYGDLGTQYFDDSGDPLVNGKVYFYETGTTTLKATYADVDYTIANTNPVILTAAGRQPNIFFEGVAKAILTTSAGTQILVRDPVGDTAESFGNPWISSKRYSANDVVQGSDGQYYVSLINGNINLNPVTTTGNWTFLYSIEWSAGTTYKEGSVITYQTLLYQSLQSTNLNKNPVTETAYWVIINLAYVSTVTYTVGQNVVGPDGVFYTALRTTIGDTPASSPSDWVGTSAAAAASASAALASQVAAAASASTATTQASNASTSASTATTQAGLASTSASTATTQAGISTTQAGIATTQAGIATTQASNAAASAVSADASAVAAAASAASIGTTTGTGSLVRQTSPTLITPALGTPSSATLTNATGLPISTGVSGLGTGIATALAVNTGSAGAPVLLNGALGTPSSGTVTNLTGTASININGTVGATTPGAGAFTTLSASGGLTLTASAAFPVTGAFLRSATNQLIFTGGSSGYLFGAASGGSTYATLDSTGLAVTGTLSATGAITNTAGTANGVVYLNGSKVLTSGAGIQSSDGTNLIIGAASARASSLLDVRGNVTVGSNASYYGTLSYNAGTGTFDSRSEDGIFTWTRGSGSVVSATLDTSGNLGIGCTPTERLQVKTTAGEVISVYSDRNTNGQYVGGVINAANNSSGALVAYGAIYANITSNTAGSESSSLRFWTRTAGTLTDKMVLDASGNLGLGVTPSAWNVAKAIQINDYGAISSAGGYTRLSNNAYLSTWPNTWTYINTGAAALYEHDGASHVWKTAPSGTAGNAITFTEQMNLSATALTMAVPVTMKGYTVATLPAGTAGMKAYVTDALAPAFLTTLVGGGAAYSGAQYNGAAWVGD